MRYRITMPKWPAYVMAAAAAACAWPALTTPPPAEAERYRAIGQEPGWTLAMAGGRIDYSGDHGATRIAVPRPDPVPTFTGRRYETDRLTVEISQTRCNDPASGRGYEHQVLVTADGATVRGCGGQRRADWDA
jgi:uncharacterized membrane protein